MFKNENETVAGIWNVLNKPNLLTKGSTIASVLFSRSGRGALIGQCSFWGLVGNNAIQCEKELSQGGCSSPRCPFCPRYSCYKSLLRYFFPQGTNILHIEPKALKCSYESACEWGPELPQPSAPAEPKKMLRPSRLPQQVTFQMTPEDPASLCKPQRWSCGYNLHLWSSLRTLRD